MTQSRIFVLYPTIKTTLMKENLLATFSKNYSCNVSDPFQQLLDRIYCYIDEPTRQLHRMRISLFIEIMHDLRQRGLLKEKSKALDIGSNCGIYSKLVSEFGFSEVTGIDIDAPLIAVAQKEFGSIEANRKISFQVFNAEELNDNEKVDFILCTEVIEHTKNPHKVIEHIHQKLNAGGIAVITLPNANSFPYLLTKLSYNLRGKKIGGELFDHLQYPSSRSKKLFDFPDLKLIKTTGTNLFYWYFLHKFPGFKILNKLNYHLAKTKLLDRYSQFYFLVLQKGN